MNGSAPFQSSEGNLFEFHFSSSAPFDANQNVEKFQPSMFEQPPQPYYAYYSDGAPDSNSQPESQMFSSPQLKPVTTLAHQRKRFKTLVPSKHALLSPGFDKDKADSENAQDDDSDEDDGETGSETDSNNESGDPNAKRGKYKIYTEQEKSTIINFMMKHGMQKTLEIFSGNAHKITKRKLKSWLDGQFKIKGVKGRKTNDPNRDQALYDWCLQFQKDYGRAPTRKETTKKALEISEDPSFQASKGWLDKFSRKYNFEFTPLKIIPMKNNKKKLDGFLLDNDSLSSASGSDSSVEGISPLIQSMQTMQVNQPPQQGEMKYKPWVLDNPTANTHEYGYDQSAKMNPYFNNQNSTYEGMNMDNKNMMPPFEQNYYQPPPNNFYNNTNNGYPMNFQPSYQMNQQGNFPLDYLYLPNNPTQQPDVTNFFNSGVNYDPNSYLDDQTKLEHPY